MMNRMSISKKLVGFGVAVTCMLWLVGIYGISHLQNGGDRTVMVSGLMIATLVVFAVAIALARSMVSALTEITTMTHELAQGHLGNRLPMDRLDELGRLAEAMNELAGYLQTRLLAALENLGHGLPATGLQAKDERNAMTLAVMNAAAPLQSLGKDLRDLAERHDRGESDAAIDPGKYEGLYREVAELANQVAAGHGAAVKKMVAWVGEMGKGNFEASLERFSGNNTFINDSIELLRDHLKAIRTDAVKLGRSALQGNLSARADVSAYQGDFRTIAQCFNETFDAVQQPFAKTADYIERLGRGEVPPKITDSYNGDFNTLKNDLNQCVEAIASLITGTEKLAAEIVEGNLSVRADSSRYQGDFRKIMLGINGILDAIMRPLNAASDYFEKISRGDIPEKVTAERKGDFNRIKGSLNRCIEAVNRMYDDTQMLAKAALEGKLDVRADAAQHEGDYQKIVQGFNDTIGAIVAPVMEADAVLEKIAGRDLVCRVQGDYKGDLAKVKESVNTAADHLDQALTMVSEATEQVASASQQIASGSQSLAQGANEQASSLEQVSSSLEEMSSMTKQNAENANQAKTLAGEANSNALQGKQAMARMSEAINKIKESSDQTAKIVKTIDEIAMQTNLLALNAAVEAARAGEAGRGFAVVAEEVRNLAQRSAEAAKNTANMIEESVRNAEEGVSIAGDVSQAFESIAAGNIKVDNLIAEIAAASQEQSQGIEQVNAAVSQLDQVTQQNAANSEESASAAEELSSQAEELQSLVAQFKLSETPRKQVTPNHGTGFQAKSAGQPKAGRAGKVDKGTRPATPMAAGTHGFDPEKLIPLEDAALKEF